MTEHPNAQELEHAHMSPRLRQDLQKRLTLIVGQVRGIERMVESDRYCVDVLTQIASVREALRQVGRIVMHNHLRNCVSKAVSEGNTAAYDELMSVIDHFSKQG